MDIIKNILITEENIADLMVTAFEGGINYWCDKVTIIYNPADKKYASDVIAHGGELNLMVEVAELKLSRDMVLEGIKKVMEHFKYDSFEKMFDEHDATTADIIIQFALFNKIVFG